MKDGGWGNKGAELKRTPSPFRKRWNMRTEVNWARKTTHKIPLHQRQYRLDPK
jgi:hypothetical protein